MNGILFKNAAALEEATKLDVIIFDKTGTLTMGQPEVVDVVPARDVAVDYVLSTAAAVEQGSDHPLAQAILRRARDLAVPVQTGFENLEGMGARARIDGEQVFLGNRRLMDSEKLELGVLTADAQRCRAPDVPSFMSHGREGHRPHCNRRCAASNRRRYRRKTPRARCPGRNADGRQRRHRQRIAGDLGLDMVLADVLPARRPPRSKNSRLRAKESEWSAMASTTHRP